MKPDDTLCYCFHISQRKIVNFIRVHQPRRVSQVSECGGAGTGCGWCIPYLKRCFNAQTAGNSDDLRDITPDEYERQREAYIAAGHGTPPQGKS